MSWDSSGKYVAKNAASGPMGAINVYHQHYITGGQIFHVADAPLAVNKAIINMEQ